MEILTLMAIISFGLFTIALGLLDPSILIVSAIIAELWFHPIDIYNLTPYNLVYIVALPVCFALIARRKMRFNAEFKRISFSYGIVLVTVFLSILFNNSALYSLVKSISYCIPLLIFYVVIDSRAKLEKMAKILMFAAVISSLFGIIQVLSGSDFIFYRDCFIGLGERVRLNEEFQRIFPRMAKKNRAMGLSWADINLSYHLLPVTMAAITLMMLGYRESRYLKVSIIITSIALFMTLTRSAFLGLAVGLMSVIHFTKGRQLRIGRRFIAMSIVVVAISLISYGLLEIETAERRLTNFEEVLYSMQVRLGLSLAGIVLSFRNLIWGIGPSSQTFKELSYYLPIAQDFPMIGVSGVHNNFLKVGVYFGVPAMVFLILFYRTILTILVDMIKNSEDAFVYQYSLAIFAALVAYMVNSFFHNYGPLGESMFWFFVGAIPVLAKFKPKYSKGDIYG